MVHSTFQHPPHSHTLSVYTVLREGGEGGGGQRECTVEGQQYTSTIVSVCISSLQNLLNRMPQSLLTGQLKEKPTYRVWRLYSSFVHDPMYVFSFHLYRMGNGNDDISSGEHCDNSKFSRDSYLYIELFIFVDIFP
jgi:hypothetical protein